MKAKCCKQRCKRKLCMSAVVGIITSFWALRKPSQDALLWSLQHPVLAPVADDGDMDDEGSSSSGTEVKETISFMLGNFAMCCLCQVFESAELPLCNYWAYLRIGWFAAGRPFVVKTSALSVPGILNSLCVVDIWQSFEFQSVFLR